MIEKLTKEQEKKLSYYRDEGIGYGLMLEDDSLSIDELTKLVNNVYSNVKLKNPKTILYVDSPLSCLYAIDDMIKVNSYVNSKVYSKIRSQVYYQVDSQVDSQVGPQVRSQVRSQVESQVYSQVYSQVQSQVHSQVYYQVESQIYSQVRSQVDSQVRSQVYSQVYSQINSQVDSQVQFQIYSQVHSQENIREIWNSSSPFYGQYEQYWLQYCNFFKNECNIKNLESIIPLLELSKRVGHCFFYEDLAVISKRPVKLNMIDGKLHSLTSPSIEFKDGFSIYCKNGKVLEGGELEFIKWINNDSNK